MLRSSSFAAAATSAFVAGSSRRVVFSVAVRPFGLPTGSLLPRLFPWLCLPILTMTENLLDKVFNCANHDTTIRFNKRINKTHREEGGSITCQGATNPLSFLREGKDMNNTRHKLSRFTRLETFAAAVIAVGVIAFLMAVLP